MAEKLNFYSASKQFKAIMPPSMPDVQKWLLCILFDYADERLDGIWVTNKTLFNIAGLSKSVFYRHLSELKSTGVLLRSQDRMDSYGNLRATFRIDGVLLKHRSKLERDGRLPSLDDDESNFDQEEKKGERPKSVLILGLKPGANSPDFRTKDSHFWDNTSPNIGTAYIDEPPLKEPSPEHTPICPQGGADMELQLEAQVPSDTGSAAMEMAVSEWNALAAQADLAKCTVMTPVRRKKLGNILAKFGIEGWMTVLHKIPKNEFFLGNGNRGWKINFDFLMRIDKFVEILESVDSAPKPKKRKEAPNMFDLDLPPIEDDEDGPPIIDGVL